MLYSDFINSFQFIFSNIDEPGDGKVLIIIVWEAMLIL